MFSGNKRKDFKSVFSSPEGERVLGELYRMCGYNHQIFSPDPQTTAFNAGKHRIAQGISSILNQSEEDIHRAMQVAQKAIITEKVETK